FLPAHLPDHRGRRRPAGGNPHPPQAAHGRRPHQLPGTQRGRVRPLSDVPLLPLPRTHVPPPAVALRSVPYPPRRGRGDDGTLEKRAGPLPQEADLEIRPAPGAEVAPAHRPDQAAPRPAPRGSLRPHPPQPLRRVPVHKALAPGVGAVVSPATAQPPG